MIKERAIVISIIPYGETSQILRVIAQNKAHIAIMAKGWRKKQEPVLRFCEYEFNLTEPKEEGLYFLNEANFLEDFSSYPTTSTWAAAEAGAELISNILISNHEAEDYFLLLRNYLSYLKNIPNNGILLFWRLFLRIFMLLGISPEIGRCSICGQNKSRIAANNDAELICADCFESLANPAHYTLLQKNTIDILDKLPQIGNHLESTSLNRSTVSEINKLFTSYYSAHQKQTLKLKSLSVLSQFY
jgi:DNA repair protein RecO